MTSSRLISRSAVAAGAILVALLPLAAQTRRHAAVPPSNETVTLTGIVTDATNGQPLQFAQVSSGSHHSAFTDATGTYKVDIPKGGNIAVTAEQFAYNSQTLGVAAQSATSANFALTPKPTVTVHLTSPQGDPAKDTYDLAVDTAQFAYIIPFSGYISSQKGNFCKDDGTPFTPDKQDIKRVIGPAVPVNFSPCCTIGPVMKAQVEMKSGAKFNVYWNDSCFGYEVDFLGREKSSGKFQYFRFTDISEVDIP